MGRPTTLLRCPNYLGPAKDVKIDDLAKLERQGGWILEPKVDGMFASLTIGRPHVLNSRDARTGPVKGSNAGDIPKLVIPELPRGRSWWASWRPVRSGPKVW